MILRDFNETFAHRLRDPQYLAAYLAACLKEGLPAFYLGLRKAVQAHEGGFSWLARETGMVRAGLYQALSANGNPSFRTVHRVLVALGVDTGLPGARVAGGLPGGDADREAIPAQVHCAAPPVAHPAPPARQPAGGESCVGNRRTSEERHG